MKSKGQISINFNYRVNFKDFSYKTVYVFSQIKDIKHIERTFDSGTWVIVPVVGLGDAGDQKLELGDLRWRPIELRVLVIIYFYQFYRIRGTFVI